MSPKCGSAIRPRQNVGDYVRSTKNDDRIKPIESLLAGSLSNFQIANESGQSGQQHPTFRLRIYLPLRKLRQECWGSSAGAAASAGKRFVRSVGDEGTAQVSFEFRGPLRDTDNFEIALPAGYQVDELPPPMDVDYSFASYHSKTEANGQTLHYSRSLEIKELSVPVSKIDELKKFYRMIASDERNTAVLKPAEPAK